MPERAVRSRSRHPSHDDHDPGGQTYGSTENNRKPALVAGINLVGFLAELAGGPLFGPIAFLSDAFYMLFDASRPWRRSPWAMSRERRDLGSGSVTHVVSRS